MKERPILFNGAMVQAILEGRKTQTRRECKDQPSVATDNDASWRDSKCDLWRNAKQYARDCSPFGKPGDRLYVRETWQHAPVLHCHCPQGCEPSPCDDWLAGTGCESRRGPVLYAADGEIIGRWRPSIHMPRWASRITLEIVSVRVERLNQISQADAKAEGITYAEALEMRDNYPAAFRSLWHSIHAADGPNGWAANPWVWIVEFKRI